MEKLMDKYLDLFGDGFPMFQMQSKTEEEIKAILERCIKEKKDAYDLGYVSDDADIFY